MTSIKNVVIIGAGGNLGPSVLSTLLESSSFNVSVLSRESSSATFPSGVNVIKANYDSFDSLKAAFVGQDAVLSLVGGMAIGDQNKLIDAAIAAGVKRFLPSEYGSNTQDERVVKIVPAFKSKVDAVDYLKSKESDTFSWSSLITGPFFDWGLKVGFIGFDLANKKVQLIDGGKGRFSASTLRQIGLAIIKILENPSETKNKHIVISSFTTSQNEILAALEEISGDKYTTTEVSSQDLIAEGGKKLSEGDFSGILTLIQGAAFGDHGLGDLTPTGLWNDKLGLQQENFKDTIKSVLN